MPRTSERSRNHYRCPNDGSEWQDAWSCTCNDKCPACNAEIEPYFSEELCLECGFVVDDAEDGRCPLCRQPIKVFDGL